MASSKSNAVTSKGNTMSFEFNPNKVTAVQKINEVRQECTTYESAMSYVRDRLKEMEKTGKWTWIQNIEDINGNESHM